MATERIKVGPIHTLRSQSHYSNTFKPFIRTESLRHPSKKNWDSPADGDATYPDLLHEFGKAEVLVDLKYGAKRHSIAS